MYCSTNPTQSYLIGWNFVLVLITSNDNETILEFRNYQ